MQRHPDSIRSPSPFVMQTAPWKHSLSGVPNVTRLIHSSPDLRLSWWPPNGPHDIVDVMSSRFTTILVASALTLTIAGCSGMPFGTPEVPQPTAVATADGTFTSPQAGGTNPADSSASEAAAEVMATHVIDFEGDRAYVTDAATGERTAVGAGLTITASTDDGLVFAVPRVENLTKAGVPTDLSGVFTRDGTLALALSQPYSEGIDFPWTYETTESDTQWTLTVSNVLSSSTDAPKEVSVLLADTAVESARWVQELEGPRVIITPSEWARTGSLAVQQYGWSTVLRDAPEVADYPGASLEHQFQCHAIGALDKETWNLETWYEDIGLLNFMAARCNPVD